jgi:DNA-binding transcriptional LysR family regulator
VETRYLVSVVAVARHGSVTRAARELYMCQSTLSRQIGRLERELGVALFTRGPRSVSLTEHGRVFLPAAVRVIEAAAAAEAAVKGGVPCMPSQPGRAW